MIDPELARCVVCGREQPGWSGDSWVDAKDGSWHPHVRPHALPPFRFPDGALAGTCSAPYRPHDPDTIVAAVRLAQLTRVERRGLDPGCTIRHVPGASGRPTKLNGDRIDRIVSALSAGAPISVAASRGGVAESTYHEWDAKGTALLEAADHDLDHVPEHDTDGRPARLFAEFSERTTRARHDWELGRLARIQEQGAPHDVTTRIVRTKQVLNPKADEEGQPAVLTLTDTEERTTTEVDWRADAWLLERRRTSEYGKVMRAEITGPEGLPIQHRVEDLVARGEAAVVSIEERRRAREAEAV